MSQVFCDWCGRPCTRPILVDGTPVLFLVEGTGEVLAFCSKSCAWQAGIDAAKADGLTGKEARRDVADRISGMVFHGGDTNEHQE